MSYLILELIRAPDTRYAKRLVLVTRQFGTIAPCGTASPVGAGIVFSSRLKVGYETLSTPPPLPPSARAFSACFPAFYREQVLPVISNRYPKRLVWRLA